MRAFAWLAGELGFDLTVEESLCSRPWARAERAELRPDEPAGGFSLKVNEAEPHRSLIARVDGRRFLADAGFPFPALVPLELPSKEISSSFGTLSVASAGAGGDGGGLRVTCDARGENAELLRVGAGAGARAPTALASTPCATRVLDDRVLHWENGALTVLDAWSVLRYPLAGAERAAFESLFALNLEDITLPAVPAGEFAPALTVFHTMPLPPDVVRGGLARVPRPTSDLVAPPEDFVEAVPGGSRVARRATFRAAVPAAGPGESVRKTLVFHLAMDLLRLGQDPGA